MTTATAKDLRHKTAAILDRVRRGQEVVITYRGRSVAVLAPLEVVRRKELTSIGFGMWQGRKDVGNVERWLRKLRAPRHKQSSSTRTS